MDNYIVYKHTSPSGKVYIGITRQKPEKRFDNGNGYRQNEYFFNAIKKHGWEKFKHEILFTGLSKQDAEETEKRLISEYGSTDRNRGYNLSLGGESGNKFTEASKKKISDGLKKYFVENPSALEEMRQRNVGRKASEETKLKMSQSQREAMTPERRKRLSDARKGKRINRPRGIIPSEETRKKISAAKKGKHIGGRGRKPRPVVCVDTGIVYKSAVSAADFLGVNFSNIYRCCSGERGTAYGYVWRYASDDISDKEAAI